MFPKEVTFKGDRWLWFDMLRTRLKDEPFNCACEPKPFVELCSALRLAGAGVDEAYAILAQLWPVYETRSGHQCANDLLNWWNGLGPWKQPAETDNGQVGADVQCANV